MARTERSERELNQDINAAIAGTEEEIFADALDGELDEGDEGDTELEEQGEGLEGDDLEEEDIEEEADEEGAEEEEDAEEDEDASEDGEVEEDDDEREQPRDERGRFERDQPRIPPERLRQTSERARQAEQREREIQERYAVLEARFNDMQTRLNSAPQPAPRREQPVTPPKPDMFVDPEGYEKWMLERAEERAVQHVQRSFAQREEQQRIAFNQRAEASLAAAERGERGFEFRAAYNQLLTLNPQHPQARAIVQGIVYSPDPAAALFEWWDNNGGPEYREHIFAQLSGSGRGREERRAPREDRAQPRHVIRRAQPMRSLNSASGSSSHRVSNPEMLDGSEGSVFDYATKR